VCPVVCFQDLRTVRANQQCVARGGNRHVTLIRPDGMLRRA
jgi:hypothetical protein